ncbi:conjugal transfer protein TraB [Rhizobium sp.]|uniref:conjugal transfer protein TraB n=1 Tax=Rhizobium sp. TaxID=391 RepID=UPI002AA8C960
MRSVFCIAGGILTGTLGWCGIPQLLPVGMLFPGFWAFAPSRVMGALVAGGHFLGASRGLPQGVSLFFGPQFSIGIALWLAASSVFVAVHAALWTAKPGWQRSVRYLVAVILMAVPPFGIVGWASPITAAGILFPAWGWLGLAITAILLGAMTQPTWKIAVLVIAAFATLNAATWTASTLPSKWRGINTTFRFDRAGQYADYQQHLQTIEVVRKAAASGAKHIVLPESAFGIWTPTTERLWQQSLEHLDVTVIGGAIKLDATGYDSVLIEVSANGSKILYRQRMPVPVSMWQPWNRLFGESEGAHATLFDNPVIEGAGYRAAPLICYEQLILWPVLQSMLYRPDTILAVGNGWWTGGSNIVAIQKASALAWSRLFNIPLVIAFNE